jgi:hypothetical protein
MTVPGEPEIGTRWTIRHLGDPHPVEYRVVQRYRTNHRDWFLLEVVFDSRADPHLPGFQFNVVWDWFIGRGRRIDPA